MRSAGFGDGATTGPKFSSSIAVWGLFAATTAGWSTTAGGDCVSNRRFNSILAPIFTFNSAIPAPRSGSALHRVLNGWPWPPWFGVGILRGQKAATASAPNIDLQAGRRFNAALSTLRRLVGPGWGYLPWVSLAPDAMRTSARMPFSPALQSRTYGPSDPPAAVCGAKGSRGRGGF